MIHVLLLLVICVCAIGFMRATHFETIKQSVPDVLLWLTISPLADLILQ